VAVDIDITGNTATNVDTIQDCASLPGPGSALTFDVIVDQVPNAGLGGFSGDIIYDQSVLKVTADDPHFLTEAGGDPSSFNFIDSVPDRNGDFRFGIFDLSDNHKTGEGVIIRITVEAIANGTSTLKLDNRITGDHEPDVLDADGDP
jgi:hypothetical protein